MPFLSKIIWIKWWLYRDDTYQNVLSADDIYDAYERSVGGNSIFLPNIRHDGISALGQMYFNRGLHINQPK